MDFLTANSRAGRLSDMAVSHSYFRAEALNPTGYIDDYAYAKAAKQSSKVRRSCWAKYCSRH